MAYAYWRPAKPEDQYSDEEIRQTPPFANMAKTLHHHAVFPDSTILSLTREALRVMWEDARGAEQFRLRRNASQRTKQRWRAHMKGTCANNERCRFCRRAQAHHDDVEAAAFSAKCFKETENPFIDALPAVQQLANQLNQHKAQQMTDTRKPPLASANSVLAETVANEYYRAAKKVARKKATVEIHQAAFTAGMMVYHRFAHHPCILLAETDPGIWRIELKDGSTENEVPVAILTPVKPLLLARAGISIKKGTLAVLAFFYTMYQAAFFKAVKGKPEVINGFVKEQTVHKVRKLPILFLLLVSAATAVSFYSWM